MHLSHMLKVEPYVSHDRKTLTCALKPSKRNALRYKTAKPHLK